MPRKQKKYHYIYKTTCQVNGKYYLGMHSTDDLDDGYIGSGKHLWNSIRKHGRENFVCEKLEFFDDRKALVERERTLVDDEMVKDPMCMNLRPGGEGGWSVEQQKLNALKSNARQKILRETDPDWVKRKSNNQSTGHIKCYENGREKFHFYDWTGKSHSDETRKKMVESKKLLEPQKGTKNSQYGTCWIYSVELSKNKKIKKEKLVKYEKLGWIKGMRPEYNKQSL